MKRIIILLLGVVMMLSLSACTGKNANKENSDKSSEKLKFSDDVFQRSLEESRIYSDGEDNFIFSPISANSAINMFKYTKDGEACKKDIDEYLHGKEYLSYSFPYEKYTSTNRIWVNENFDFKSNNKINAFVYKMNMDDSAKATKEKNDFVNKVTHGFIKETPSVFDSETIYDIMNIVYFKDAWFGGPLEQDENTTVFNNVDKSKTKTKMLYTDAKYYYENDTAYMVEIPYEHGNDFVLIYPKKNIDDVSLDKIKDNKVDRSVNIKFPEFEAYSEFDLSSYLSAICTNTCIDMPMLQIAKIKVDRKGTEAAAVTEILKETAYIEEEEPLELTFDKPFYYMIYDNTNEDVAFIGKLSKLEK